MNKKEFTYHPYTNEYRHNNYPISIDYELFKDMSDDELTNFFNSKLEELNNEISSIKKPKKEETPLTDEEITSMFAELRKKLSESFKDYYFSGK
jgi:hypothetical protein